MMAVREFDSYIKETVVVFRERLMEGDDSYLRNMKDWIVDRFSKCTNQFEEDTLIENLKEEFEDYLRSVKEN